jgi:hypothetical protein
LCGIWLKAARILAEVKTLTRFGVAKRVTIAVRDMFGRPASGVSVTIPGVGTARTDNRGVTKLLLLAARRGQLAVVFTGATYATTRIVIHVR